MKNTNVRVALTLVFLISLSQLSLMANANIFGIPTDLETAHGIVYYNEYPFQYRWVNTHKLNLLGLNNYAIGWESIYNMVQLFGINSTDQIVVANTLIGLEIYKDANNNSIIDADYEDASTECMYFLTIIDYSDFINEGPHKESNNVYTWKTRIVNPEFMGNYDYIYGPTNPGSINITFDYIEFNYRYFEVTTELQTYQVVRLNIKIGAVNQSTIKTSSGVSNFEIPDSWSLSLLYSLSLSLVQCSKVSESVKYRLQYVKFGYINNYFFKIEFSNNYTYIENKTAVSYPTHCIYTKPNAINEDLKQMSSYSNALQGLINAFMTQLYHKSLQVNIDADSSTYCYRSEYPIWKASEINHNITFVIFDINSTTSIYANVFYERAILITIPCISISVAIIIYSMKKRKIKAS